MVDSIRRCALCAAARDNGIYALIGFSEKVGGSRYMAQALIGPDGRLLYTRRKLKPTHVERSVNRPNKTPEWPRRSSVNTG